LQELKAEPLTQSQIILQTTPTASVAAEKLPERDQ
jgi:hypothetical protein